MKEVLAGIAITVVLACLFYLVYNTFNEKERKIVKKKVVVTRPNFDLGYYVGIPNNRSPRFITPLRPDIYKNIPNEPTLIPRPKRIIRRVYA